MELIKIELDKINKKSLLSLATLSGVPAVFLAIKLIKNLNMKGDTDISLSILAFSSALYLGMILPALMTYIAVMITKVENENSGWKQLMLLPIKKNTIYLTKFKVMIFTLMLSIIGYIVSDIVGSIIVTGSFSFNILIYGLVIFITSLPIIILLFIIGRNCASIIPVVAIGIGILITETFIVQSKYWIFVPWTYSMALVGSTMSNNLRVLAITISAILSVVMFVIDYNIFTKSDIKEK